jgi:hypothetical protein
MTVPEGLHQFRQINSLRWLTWKSGSNTFQYVISRLANRVWSSTVRRLQQLEGALEV